MKFAVTLAAMVAFGTSAIASEAPHRRPAVAGPEEREAAAIFSACVIARSPEKVASVLTMDFRTDDYRRALAVVARNNEDCMRKTGHYRMRLGNLPMAAALAEAGMKSGTAPLNVRLARAAAGRPAPTYSPSDTMAMCVARSMPDQVAALFASRIGSAEENTAAAALTPAVTPCSPAGTTFDVAPAGLRAVLATASYRLLAAQEG